MNIQAINSFRALKIKSNTKYNKQNHNNKNQNLNKPFIKNYSSYPLYFLGGASLNLSQTYENLENFNKEKGNIFPENIENEILKALENRLDQKETLVKVHKKYYKNLLDCQSLEEIKILYPEFKNVLSDDEVEYNKGSFIEKFKNGELKTPDGQLILNPNKDLSMQLIQMYWGDCLSLTDLKNIFSHNMFSIFKKLNIDTLNPVYAHYLKLSDEEKNKTITEAMQRNRKPSEINYKRKPLSVEHKQKISDSLKKYYEQNPNIAFERTKKDREYFEKNPLQKEIFSQVLLRTWNSRDCQTLKKRLAKAMKKKEITDSEIVELNTDEKQGQKLKEFWNRNKWAKEIFSKAMTKSWHRQKVLAKAGLIYEPVYEGTCLPATHEGKIILGEFVNGLIKKSDNQFLTLNDCCFLAQALIPDDRDKQLIEKTNSKYNSYNIPARQMLIDYANNSSHIKNTYHTAISTVVKELEAHIDKYDSIINSPKTPLGGRIKFNKEKNTIEKVIQAGQWTASNVKSSKKNGYSIEDLFDTYYQMLKIATDDNYEHLRKIIEGSIYIVSEEFEYAENHPGEIPYDEFYRKINKKIEEVIDKL